jgi:hypothetical protein
MDIELYLRLVKGSPLEWDEVDDNFTTLKDAILVNTGNSAGPEPTSPVAAQWWLDTDTSPNVLKIRNLANTQWLIVALIDQSTGAVLFEVAQGGTGRETLTDKAVLLGGGTNPVGFVAPGANDEVLAVDNGEWVSKAFIAAAVYQA